MASQISDISNGVGFLYETDQSNNITAARANTIQGIRDMLQAAVVNPPLMAARGAISTITVTGVASTGAFSAINVNGVNQLASNLNVLTSNTTTEAAALAAAINAFTPGTPPDITAFSVGNIVYLVEPSASAGALNGVTPVVSVTSGTITTTVTPFAGGSPVSGVYDRQYGRFYWLDATGTAVPDSIAAALDVTKYLTARHLNTGFPSLQNTIVSDQLIAVDRYSAITNVRVLNEGAAARNDLDFINPNGFIEADLVFLCQDVAAQAQDVISAPNSSNPNANIYLTADQAFQSDNNAILQLKYTYDAVKGAIFVEVGRSTPASSTSIPQNNKLYCDAVFGDDATAVREEFTKPFQTADAMIAAAQIGDSMHFYPGTYTVTSQLLSKNGTKVTCDPAAILTGNAYLANIGDDCSLQGGDIYDTGALTIIAGDNCLIEVNNLILAGNLQVSPSGDNVIIRVANTLTALSTVIGSNCDMEWGKLIYTNPLNLGGAAVLQWNSAVAPGSVCNCRGDIYVQGNCAYVFYNTKSTGMDYYPFWEGRLFIDSSVTIAIAVAYAIANKITSAISPFRFKLRGEMHIPVAANAIYCATYGDIDWDGDIFMENQGSTDAVRIDSGLDTIAWLKGNIYTDGTSKVVRLSDVNCRAVFQGFRMYAPNVSSSVQGDVASCKYQSMGDNWAMIAVGGNASDELGGTDIQISPLMT